MSKKLFCFALCAMLLALSFPAEAQQAGKVYRIGYLTGRFGIDLREEALRQGLRQLGYIEGKNLVIEWRFAKGKRKRLAKLAAELVRLKSDVIVTPGTGVTLVVKKATSTIPIVMANVPDAVQLGIVASLAQPGGNITGLSTRNADLAGKRLELLKEAFPQISRVAALWDPSRRGVDAHFKGTEAAARVLGVQLQSLEVRRPYDLENAFRTAVKARAEAISVMGAGLPNHRARIVKLAVKNRLPVMYSSLRYVRAGGLMAYAPDRVDLFRRAAIYVDKILKGAQPGDLPIEQPTRFELVINLKAAKQIGVTIAPGVLYRADKVIK